MMKIIHYIQELLNDKPINNSKLVIKDENILFFNNVFNELKLETYTYNKTLLNIVNNIENHLYSFTCVSNENCTIEQITNILNEKYKDEIKNQRIDNNYLIFNFPNKNKNSEYKNIDVYINIFSLNIKYDVYFTLTNFKLHINTSTLCLINNLDEFKPEYISKLNKKILNNKEFYDMCVNDLFNNNIQFLLSHKLNSFVKNKFSNKYEFKKRIDYYLAEVFHYISIEKRNKLMNTIENDFKETNKMSLKYLIIRPKDVNVDDYCLICFENLNSKDCFKLPCCGKFMHKNCVMECEKHFHNCPNCRRNWYE